MKYRKLFLLVLLIMSLSACSSNTNDSSSWAREEPLQNSSAVPQETNTTMASGIQVEKYLDIHPIVTAYLSSLSCHNSHILTIQTDKLSDIETELPDSKLSVFIEKSLQTLRANYRLDIKDGPIQNGDMAVLEIGEEGSSLAEEGIYVIASSDYVLFHNLQENLIGQKRGDRGNFSLPESFAQWLLSDYTGDSLVYHITEVYSVSDLDDTTKAMMVNNGFENAEELYRYLLIKNKETIERESKYCAGLAYLEEAIKCCEYFLDEGDLQAVAQGIVDDYTRQAQSLGMSLEELWAWIRSGMLYFELDEDMEKAVSFLADFTIKAGLLIGAKAQEKQIELSDNEVETMWKSKKELYSEKEWSEIKYLCLEDKLFPLMDPKLEGAVWDVAIRQKSEAVAYPPIPDEPEPPRAQAGLNEIFNYINRKISRINLLVLHNKGSEMENQLMECYPIARLDGPEKTVIDVSFSVSEEELERMAALFETLVGKFECVDYHAVDQIQPSP